MNKKYTWMVNEIVKRLDLVGETKYSDNEWVENCIDTMKTNNKFEETFYLNYGECNIYLSNEGIELFEYTYYAEHEIYLDVDEYEEDEAQGEQND